MNALRPLWYDILLVWTFFTRIPAPHFITHRFLADALWALPLVCLLIATVQFWGFVLITFITGGSGVALLWLVIAPIIVTGALHWDGLADLADGLGVGPDRRTEVMRDSAVGAFAVLTLIAVFLMQLGLFADLRASQASIGFLSIGFLPLLFVALLSRQFMALLWAKLPPADALSQANRLGTPDRWLHGGLFAGFVLVAWALGLINFWSVLALIGFAFAWGAALWHWLSGINGDGLGATQVITETFILILMVASHI